MLFGKRERRITRVLVLEDEPLVAFDTEHFLSSEGFEIVATLDSVAGALGVLADDADIHLILADISLSDGSGVDVARDAMARGVPVLFVTGSLPDEARGLSAGCLFKPYAQRDLLAAIAAIDRVSSGKAAPRRMPRGFDLFLAPAG